MNWNIIGSSLFAAFIIWMLIRNRGGIKALMQRSQEAPQHWGTFVLLMLAVFALVYFLIKA